MIADTNVLISYEVLIAMGAGWLGLVAAAISPGPNMFAVVAASLGGGLARGLQVNLGIAFGAFIWATLVNVGLATLLEFYPVFVQILTGLGGSYLLFLSYKGFKAAFQKNVTAMIKPGKHFSPLKNVLHGLIVTFSNPKVALFWTSISALIISVTTDWRALLVFGVGAGVVVFFIYGVYAWAFSLSAFRALYGRFRRWADGLFDVVFAALALVVLSNLLVI